MIPWKSALALVQDGLAIFAHEGKAIQLTFSKLAQLRDRSLKIDEAMLIAYASGKRQARAVIDYGWTGFANVGLHECSRTTKWTPEMMSQSQERIQSFV